MPDQPIDSRLVGRSTLALLIGDITQVPADAIVNAANSAFALAAGWTEPSGRPRVPS